MRAKNTSHQEVTQWQAAKYYLGLMRKWPHLALPPFLLTSVGTVLVIFAPSLIVAKLLTQVSNGAGPAELGALLGYVAWMGALMLIGEAMWRVGLDLMSRYEVKAFSFISDEVLYKLMGKTLGFHANTFAGSLVTKGSRLINNVVSFNDTMIFNITNFVVSYLFVAVVLWQRAPIVLICFTVILVLFVLIVRIPIRRRSKIVRARTESESAHTGALADALTNISTIKTMAQEAHEQKLFKHYTDNRASLTLRSWLFQVWKVDTVISPFVIVINLFSLAAAIYAITNFGAPADSVFLTFSYITQLSYRMWEFNRIWRNLETQLSEAANGLTLLRTKVTINDLPEDEQEHFLGDVGGEVEFDSVNFAYEDSPTLVLRKFNLRIKAGEKIGLVGPSGGGKTTVTKLLLRLNDVTDGAVTIDGVDIRKLPQSELRAQISFVPQDTALFHRSIADNIRYGRLEASKTEVKEAARLAHVDEFVRGLPASYKTLVGERGIKLSGGQRQRVAIARAMLRQSPILVLDEATSSLDSESEKLIQDGLDTLMKGRTTIVIAHRLSTIQKMDRIVVIEKGQITEQGSHKELLDKSGTYARLWSHQSGGFLED